MATDTYEIDHNIFSAQQREQDAQLLVRFFQMPVPNEVKSAEAARPIFDDTDMIEIRVRGQKDNVVVRPIREDDKKRFRDAWRDHEEGRKSVESGTPLSQWPIMSSAQVEELKYLGFFTVEQLAGANDSVCTSIPMLQMLKNKAKTFLEYAKGAAPLEKLQAALANEKNEKEVMKRQIAELSASLAKLQGAEKAPAKTRE